ncbi:MAG: tryptophan--tRNA ligase, partial [Lachnospiraceae bacterium]|nr:tryptophan--tRNA ligase [Lachnospiraceae bacterium]
FVPIGADQKQHLEITRDIAERFNSIYGDVFTIPEPYIGKTGARVMSLQEPDKKMSKSDENPNATILLLDDRDTIIRKFKRAVTDSETEVRFDRENKPGVSNLMEIYGTISDKSMEDVEAEFAGKGYGDFKLAVGETVADKLEPLQKRYNEILTDKEYIDRCIRENDEKARYVSNKTLRKVQKKVGLTELVR